MKKLRKLKLNTKLLAVFFGALFLVSLMSSVVFFRLLGTLEEEVRVVNTEQLNAAMNRLDGELSEIIVQCKSLLRLPEIQASTSLAPSTYQMVQIKSDVQRVLTGRKYTAAWALLLKSTDKVLSSISDNTLAHFAEKSMVAEAYTADHWRNLMDYRFVQRFMPQQPFVVNYGAGRIVNSELVPMAVKSYWDNDSMILVFLQMDSIVEDIGTDWNGSCYIFDEQGTLVFHQGEPAIREIPSGSRVEWQGERLNVLRSTLSQNGLQLVRLMPESESAELVKSSLTVFVATMLASLAAVSVIFGMSLRTTIHPMSAMLDLLAQHSGMQNPGDVRAAQDALRSVLQNMEEQGRSLAQKDAVLSEYVLRSQLKNLHLDVKLNREEQSGDTYILYIQIRYREGTWNLLPVRRAELESMLQDMLSGILRRMFATTLIFQIDPGRFAAKVTLPHGDDSIDEKMARLMSRLEQEREFAWFTVVRSENLEAEAELAQVYSRILEGARMASIRQESQLLVLGDTGEPEETVEYSRSDEQKLRTAVMSRQVDAALECAEEILARNMEKPICYHHLENLCMAMVNTVASAAAEGSKDNASLSAAGGVLNVLMNQCDSARSYCATVKDFIFEVSQAETLPETEDPLLERTRQYLQENYHRDFSSEEMAAALGVSRSYLSTYYKNKTGINLSDSIQMYRVEKAMELLGDPTIRTGDVGEMVGFTGKNTYLRQFKKYTGMTPKEYQTKTNGTPV